MNDLHTYQIQVSGQLNESEMNVRSPVAMKVEHIESNSTWLSVDTDQSGLVGLMRHLHGLGIVFLTIARKGRIAE